MPSGVVGPALAAYSCGGSFGSRAKWPAANSLLIPKRETSDRAESMKALSGQLPAGRSLRAGKPYLDRHIASDASRCPGPEAAGGGTLPARRLPLHPWRCLAGWKRSGEMGPDVGIRFALPGRLMAAIRCPPRCRRPAASALPATAVASMPARAASRSGRAAPRRSGGERTGSVRQPAMMAIQRPGSWPSLALSFLTAGLPELAG